MRMKSGLKSGLLLDIVLVHLLFEDIRDDRSKLLTLFFRQFSRVLCDCIQLRILIGDPLDGFRRCVLSHEEGDLLDPLLWDESKDLVSGLFITDLSGREASVDLFLFCCCTGLAFIDLYNLKEENIKTFFDDGEWIIIHRQKTGTEADIKLLDYPKQIMEKYRGLCEDGRVFPVPNYKSCMDSLKRLGKKCGITKPLSWHMSRHSFATSVCLSNGVPIETVSSMLGHKDIKTTQVYAKITKEKLSKDVEKLSQQINNIEEFTFGNVCNDNTNTINGRV